ncbi:RNA-binding protein 20 [Trichomycterus rosablanca]|uniref:RNA-binding protein 20 n=1 Tax=Trichomycterus rosablanca TaxID=2290929 RepID=UPI002F359CE9
MKPAWDKSIFKNGQNKQLGTVHVDSAASFEHLQSTASGDKLDKKVLPVGGVGPNLLLSPASLQLAQLQAQLTLQRLKLAQSSNSAAAATILNQVLSNVAMSQPLFNQLRGSGFPSAPISFPPPPPPPPGLGTLVGSGFTQNHSAVRLNPFGGGGNSGQNASPRGECGKKTGAFQGVFLGGSTPGVSQSTQNNYQRDFYASEGQQGVYGDHGHKEQWKNAHFGKLDSNAAAGGNTWVPTSSGFIGPRADMYNPEEPTSDPKFSPAGSSGFSAAGASQGFSGYLQQQKGKEGMGMTLQAHQLNDYHGVTPSHLPHQCTICEKKVYNLKDWDQHVKGKLHIQNRSLYTDGPALAALHFSGPSEGSLASNNNTAAHSAANGQDVSARGASFLPATAMKSFPLSGVGFTTHQPGTKFPPRKPCPGRVVHICNLPEGSCTENDVINLGLPFGKVTNYILMRSTHQAFLEMAYVEAAQAMVQYYQLHPATVNDQKLLIRMSKRYKELQLKKPGKDVDSIIQDINSQRERDELHDMERYPPERARSRSPITRSLTPPSHSSSFTSCSSTHSPQGAPWNNGMGPRRGSWDWTPRDEYRDEWRNGEDDRPCDRRKPYLKPSEERGRDRFYSSHHPADDFYKKDKPHRTSHPRHQSKFRRRDGSGERHTSRRSESEKAEDGRGRRTSRRHEREDRESSNHKEAAERQSKDRSASPHNSKPAEPTERERNRESEVEDCASGDEIDSWYPKSMEELVTVDEVGGEDDSIIEPDLPEVQEERVEEEEPGTEKESAPGDQPGTTESAEEPVPNRDAGQEQVSDPDRPKCDELSRSRICFSPSQEIKGSLEESSEPRPSSTCATPEIRTPPPSACEVTHTGGEERTTAEPDKETQHVEENQNKHIDMQSSQTVNSPLRTGIEARSPSHEQEKIVSEQSIPLGVEFIVPSTGFFCKLCSLFYTSEATAKSAHCRSTVHYRNLQKYLSQLAEDRLLHYDSDAE